MQTASALDILVVDDDEPLRDMLTRSFEREGHRVTAVPDGTAALARAAEQDFDVVLLDVALGAGPAGHDVARALRARRAVVPIIMLTALDSEADVVQGLEAGGGRHLTKPFRPPRPRRPHPPRPRPRPGGGRGGGRVGGPRPHQ